MTLIALSASINAKTLVVYYSCTNNVERVVNELKTQIDCDVVEIEPAEKFTCRSNSQTLGGVSACVGVGMPSNGDSSSVRVLHARSRFGFESPRHYVDEQDPKPVTVSTPYFPSRRAGI